MSTDAQAVATPKKPFAEHQTKTFEEFDRALQDEITLHCFVRYWFALLDKLGIGRHRLREMVRPETDALPDKHIPTAHQEEQLLQELASVVKDRQPRMYAVYEEDILTQLPRISYDWLSQNAGYAESHKILLHAASLIPQKMTRPWDDPIRFITDPVTGERSFAGVISSTAPRLMLRAQAFLKDFEPARKPGRPKGLSKPAGSGRKSSVDQDVYKESWEAKQGTRRYQSNPWWRGFARKKNMLIPEDLKAQDALRKKLEEWALKGKTLSRKKVGG